MRRNHFASSWQHCGEEGIHLDPFLQIHPGPGFAAACRHQDQEPSRQLRSIVGVSSFQTNQPSSPSGPEKRPSTETRFETIIFLMALPLAGSRRTLLRSDSLFFSPEQVNRKESRENRKGP